MTAINGNGIIFSLDTVMRNSRRRGWRVGEGTKEVL
jgi:hypothetical protein